MWMGETEVLEELFEGVKVALPDVFGYDIMRHCGLLSVKIKGLRSLRLRQKRSWPCAFCETQLDVFALFHGAAEEVVGEGDDLAEDDFPEWLAGVIGLELIAVVADGGIFDCHG